MSAATGSGLDPPYMVSRRKARYAGSGRGRKGRRRHQPDGARAMTCRAAVAHRPGREATAHRILGIVHAR